MLAVGSCSEAKACRWQHVSAGLSPAETCGNTRIPLRYLPFLSRFPTLHTRITIYTSLFTIHERSIMPESVYKVIELVGTSTESWEKATAAAVTKASKSLRDLRVAEVVDLDVTLKDGKVEFYRAKVKVSFKYEGEK